jgi:putative toxin-antitoxin system antitoxin component (TIGR02293 family)
MDMHELIGQGFDYSVYEGVKTFLGATDDEMARLLGTSPRKLSYVKRHRKRLSSAQSNRLYRVAKFLAAASNTFGGRKLGCNWLRTPQTALGDAIPLDLLLTEPGRMEVEALIVRIQHGVLA